MHGQRFKRVAGAGLGEVARLLDSLSSWRRRGWAGCSQDHRTVFELVFHLKAHAGEPLVEFNGGLDDGAR
jgi:hypothetical protein